MKVPGGRGMWPAFWLNPQDQKWPPEIDILEIVNNGRDSSRNSFHFLHSGVKESLPVASSLLNNNKTYKPGFDYQDDFHTFAVEWTAERVRHFVDDVLVVDRAFRWVHKDGSDGGPAHVLVNLAVGGKWTGPPAGPEAFPAKLLLKYIRVWQR
jgi:beta-glucanase (GH16 family)